MLNRPCEPGMNPTWLWCMICFMHCWIPFANILLRIFCIYIHQRYWPVIFLFGGVFVWFWYLADGGFIECLWECSLLFNLWEEFEKIRYTFFFVCLVEFTFEVIWSWTFVCRKFFVFLFYYRFYFTSHDQSVQIISFFLIQFWWYVCF